MTDNEKRAHDFSLCILNRIIDSKIEKIKQNAIQNASDDEIINGYIIADDNVDFYEEYKEIYNLSLKSFNRDFSDDK